ncbi:MAG TPA: M48 family metallopeptidase [Candidatus Eisenbacteria bacterium]|jgi:STE24 endopeptidase|nr:M48 family metallopeptidase [Candidatus Eisenbacteria bacterium]
MPRPEAKAYQRAKIRLFLADLALAFLLLLLLQFSGLSVRMGEISASAPPALRDALYLFLFFNALQIPAMPLQFYAGYVLEKKYSLSTQTLQAWLADAAKRYALSLVFFLAVTGGFLWLLRAFPDRWWIFAAGGWFLVTFVVAQLFPTVLIPLFYPTRPLPDGPLRQRILALCARLRVRVLDVYEISLSKKTRKANAAVVGIGPTRRILLGDTLIAEFPPEEVEMVIAHELGHHVRRHVSRSFVFNAAAVTLGFFILQTLSKILLARTGASNLADPAVFPLVAFLSSLGGLALMPIQNGHSRHMEREADAFALDLLPSDAVFSALMTRLAALNLSDPEPSPWVEKLFYSHPSLHNRIRHGRSVLQRRGGPAAT